MRNLAFSLRVRKSAVPPPRSLPPPPTRRRRRVHRTFFLARVSAVPTPLHDGGHARLVAFCCCHPDQSLRRRCRRRRCWRFCLRQHSTKKASCVRTSLARSMERERAQGVVRGSTLFASRGAMRAVALRSPPVHHVNESADNRDPRTM